FKEDAANVATYESFRIKIECLIREDVVPLRGKRRPNVVSFNEDTGLASIATGTRGAAARKAFAEGSTAGCEGQPAPCGALGPLEQQLGFSPGPATGPEAVANVRPYKVPNTKVRIGFATSLPAFVYGEPPAGTDPCSDVSQYYMRCLDELGANVVVQDEANIGGRWTGPDGDGVEQWQPLSWMASTDRAVSDPTVRFAYNVDAMMVGNLADLDSDGQSAITQRGVLAGPG